MKTPTFYIDESEDALDDDIDGNMTEAQIGNGYLTVPRSSNGSSPRRSRKFSASQSDISDDLDELLQSSSFSRSPSPVLNHFTDDVSSSLTKNRRYGVSQPPFAPITSKPSTIPESSSGKDYTYFPELETSPRRVDSELLNHSNSLMKKRPFRHSDAQALNSRSNWSRTTLRSRSSSTFSLTKYILVKKYVQKCSETQCREEQVSFLIYNFIVMLSDRRRYNRLVLPVIL